MNIRFTSTLTSEDENCVAPVLLKALGSILDLLPVSYMLRIDTVDQQVYQLSGSGRETVGENIRIVARDHSRFDS